jgi:hypothetical protein
MDTAAGVSRPRSNKRSLARRRIAAGIAAVGVLGAGVFLLLRNDGPVNDGPQPGTAQWARKHYGRANAPDFRDRHIVEMNFLGEPMYVHEAAERHFLRLAQIFEARAPEYAEQVPISPDDWSYFNRDIRGAEGKSNHAYGIAIDVNALSNVLGTTGDMPDEVVAQWEIEGGDWGGDWSRPDPMHFETHLTPTEIRERYLPDGTPKEWYLEELTG